MTRLDAELAARGLARSRTHAARLIADGLVEGRAAIGGRVVLTRAGRLLADAVVRDLLED